MAYLAQTQAGQPVLILKEGTSRSRGKEAQRNNIMAAKVIAEAVRSIDRFFMTSIPLSGGNIEVTIIKTMPFTSFQISLMITIINNA